MTFVRENLVRKDSRLFIEMCAALLKRGFGVRFRVQGESMRPNLRNGDDVLLEPADVAELHNGDVVLAENADGLRVHRVSSCDPAGGDLVLRSDTGHDFDPSATRVFGKVLSWRRGSKEQCFTPLQTRFVHPLRVLIARVRRAAQNRLRRIAIHFFAIFACAFLVPAIYAQTADLQLTQTASSSAVATNGTTQSLGTATTASWAGGVATFTFPTPLPSGAMANVLLTTTGFTPAGYNVTNVVIQTVNTATGVITVALAANPGASTKLGTGTVPTGYSYSEVVTNNSSSATVTSGTVTAYMQTPANTVFESYSGTNWTCNTPTAGNTGPIICTYNTTLASGATASTLSLGFQVVAGTAFGTTIQSSATVTNSTFVDTVPSNNTSITTIIVEPTNTSDMALSMSVAPTPVFVSSTFTYTILVQNLGQAVAPATANVLSDTLPANVTFNSYSASSGWTCPTVPAVGTTGTISCSIATAMAMGTSATISITVTAPTTATTLNNTATVSLAGDPNSANNSATAYTVVQPLACATPGRDGAGGTLTGIVNAYYPPSATGPLASASNSVVLGPAAAGGAQTPITKGDLLLIIQMQDAAMNATNTSSYGHGVPGDPASGSIVLGSSGLFEFVTATNATPVPVGGGTLQFAGTGPTGGLLNSYSYALPTTASLGTATAATWAGNIATLTFPGPLPGSVVPYSVLTTTGFVPASYNFTNATIVSVNNATGVITITQPAQSLGTATTATWAAGVASLTFPIPLPSFAVVGAQLNTIGFTPAAYNLTNATIASVNNATGVITIALAAQSAGTATAATWAGGVASYTFPIPLPSFAVVGAQLTTTGFTPAAYNVANATITSANNATGVITVAIAANPGISTVRGTGTLNPVASTTNGTGTANPSTSTTKGTGSFTTQGRQTYQVIRVPQYTSATLSSGLAPLPWNGSVGGVLAVDVSSQLTLGGTVALDALGFRGAGGRILAGTGTGALTDYVTAAANPANGSKGEGIAGTPRYIAPATITTTTTATDTTGGAPADTLPGGSYARGAPGNAGGGGTDGDPRGNSENSGGGAGGNGGTGGQGGYGWNSLAATNSTDGGFGGVGFPASTSALVMGGSGGAGTTNDGSYFISNASNGADCGATCTGIYSSGGAGGGIAIIHAGSVTGTGTITSNGQNTLSTLNDSTGGGGAGGSIIVFANSGTLGGLTVNAVGGSAGNAWPLQAPGGFPGERHGPGGGGGGGVIFLTSSPVSSNVTGGSNGYTDMVQDSFGATPGVAGIVATNLVITETPGTQSGAYCASADLSVTNSGSPFVVAPGGTITYTQSATNNGPLDAVNAVFSEAVPANTTFRSITPAPGWNCVTPGVGNAGTITCTIADFAALTTANFAVGVTVGGGTASGTQIVDVDNITSGTSDPNLANNSATVITTVGAATSADLAVTNTASAPTVTAGSTVTMTGVVTNNGPASASSATFTEAIPANTTFASLPTPAGWNCNPLPPVNGTGTISCTATTAVVPGSISNFPLVLNVPAATPSGTVITATDVVSSSTPDPNTGNNTAAATTVVAGAGQVDLAVTATGTPNLVYQGNNISYTQMVVNNGPLTETNATFKDTIPANTTLVSFTPPANWTCNTIAVGGTGTFTCTLNGGQTIPSGASVSFPLVVQVNTTPNLSGTQITNTPSVSSTVGDPNPANNSVTVSTTVTNPTQADVSVVKSAAPEPVDQGTNLAYSLMVTNSGPAVAQGVNVSDPLPSQVSYLSSSTTQGSCTYTAATTTVACNLGSLSVGSSAIVTINVTANTFSSASLSYNTATVSSTTSDPNLANNTSTSTSTIQSPTAVDIAAFHASAQSNGSVILEWRTQEESRNLGFHIYREQSGGRQRITPSLIAGSALLLRGSQPQHAAKAYRWIDAQPTAGAVYWIEDVDINGTRTMHGPVSAENAAPEGTATITASTPSQVSPLLRELHAAAAMQQPIYRPLVTPRPVPPVIPPGVPRFSVTDHNAVKIAVDHEGWYHIAFADLFAAGLDRNADARSLHLFAEGIEQPLLIISDERGMFAPTDAIEFYGTGIDTPFSADRIYWLVRENTPGKRIQLEPSSNSSSTLPRSFPFTVVREDHFTYFAALLNGENNDNFFGAIVTTDPVDQNLEVAHFDTSSALPITFDLTLQGANDGQPHSINVQLNGSMIGQMNFTGQILHSQTFSVESSLVQDGSNAITLTALDGDNDISVVQSMQLHYPHTYAADANWLKATAVPGSELHITGFSNAQIRVFDITDPVNISEIGGHISANSGLYEISFAVPGRGSTERTLLAFSGRAISGPVSLTHHVPSFLDDRRTGADVVIIAHPDFVAALAPLVQLRETQNHRVLLATTDQLYDEYNYGERSPFAIQSFLKDAAAHWRVKPQSILLVGDASFDPRDYLGLGDFDLVPTRMIETAAFKTSSDDWFTDFQSTGYATIPTGRLPVRTVADTQLLVSKIVNYERGAEAGPWNGQVLLVGDQNVNANFTSAVNSAAAILPKSLQVSEILADGQDPAAVHTQLLAALNNGSLIVDYQGHGAEQQWSFTNFFSGDDANTLSNGGKLPVYIMMDCLNGFFQDVHEQSLAKIVLLSPNGGGVAVWASSGFTEQAPQATMHQALLAQLAIHPNEPLGQLILQAKSGTTDNDVRRTWILFGDPAMKLHFPTSSEPTNSGRPTGKPVIPPVIKPVCELGPRCVKGKLPE